MATAASTFFRQPSAIFRGRREQPEATTAVAVEDADQDILLGLPNDDVYFYTKSIDNSRLVRQPDTQVKGEWSAIAGVCATALLIGGMMIAPGVAGVLDSYKIQELKHEQDLLRIELRQVDVAEERMLNAPALDAMAPEHNLVRPGKDQVIRLQPKNERSFAMNRSSRSQSR
jgi:hypothetical protein